MAEGITGIIVTVILVAMVLMIGVQVFGGMESTMRNTTVFEETWTNDTITFTDNETYMAFNTSHTPVKSVTSVSNVTLTVTAGNYTANTTHIILQPDPADYYNATSTPYNITFTAWGGSDYDVLDSTATQTYSGFNLGSLIPYILFAVAIIGVILVGFKVQGG